VSTTGIEIMVTSTQQEHRDLREGDDYLPHNGAYEGVPATLGDIEARIRYVKSESWRVDTACITKHELFFPPSNKETTPERDRREARAQSFCATCKVAGECLDLAAIRDEKHGMWGGFVRKELREKIEIRRVELGLT